MSDDSGLDAIKRQQRSAMKDIRSVAFAQQPHAGEALAQAVLSGINLNGVTAASAFWPMGEEIDTRPLMRALCARHITLGLPVMQGAGKALLFRQWKPDDVLLPAGFGTQEPDGDKQLVVPQVLFVPLLAFDRAGYRLGYGGGFYDRTLAGLRKSGRPLAVGVAFAAQEVDAAPRGPYDQPLDYIVTERAVIQVKG